MATKLENLIVIAGLGFAGVLFAQAYVRSGTEPMFDPSKLGDLFQPVRQFFGVQDSSGDDEERSKRAIQRFADQAGASWDQVMKAFSDDYAKGGAFEGYDDHQRGASGIFANAGGPEGATYTIIDGDPYWVTGNGR